MLHIVMDMHGILEISLEKDHTVMYTGDGIIRSDICIYIYIYICIIKCFYSHIFILQRTIETAVKVVRKDLFRQDPKAEQNLRREIDILFKLKNCEYVVHLYHVEVRLINQWMD